MANDQIVNRTKSDMSMNDESSSTEKLDKTKNMKSSNMMQDLVQIVSASGLGVAFGILMNKSNVYLAPIIRDQMLFKRFTMIKMFLGAVGASMLSSCVIILVSEPTYRAACNAFIHRNNRIQGFHLLMGGTLIGVGMVLAGSCPGTVFVQMGSGLPNSFVTCLGAICGVLFYYGFLFKRLTKEEVPKSSIVLQQLPELTGVKRIYLNLILGSMFVGTAFVLEHYVPYKNDLITPTGLRSLVGWSPALCGIGIGSLQLFFMMLFKKSLGISTGFTVFVAQLCRMKFFKKLIPSLESFAYGVSNGTALLFALGAVGGSFMSTVSENQFPLNERYGAGVWSSFLGGFLLSLGARCAGGCTSGQGISGVTHLLIGSLIATAGMFGGGMLFATGYGWATKDWLFRAL